VKKLIKICFDPQYRKINKYNKIVDNIFDIYETKYKKLQIEEIVEKFQKETNKNEILAILIRASELVLRLKPYKVQILGVLLGVEQVIEMKTGEGKTLVMALLSIYLLKTGKKKIYNISVNEYLIKRDEELNHLLYELLGYKSTYVLENDTNESKKTKYESDIIYTTGNNIAFDYLRDQMVYRKEECVLGELDTVIIDEIDSILIDEARTPLIISSQLKVDKDLIKKTFKIATEIPREELDIDEVGKKVIIKNSGIERIEDILKIKNLYNKHNFKIIHQIVKSLEAIHLFKKEKDYLLIDGVIKIIDQNTGRISEGVRWSDGLHNAIEEKEGVEVKDSSITNATITYQSFFRLFDYITGMSGTVITEVEEFKVMYDLEVIDLPTNKEIKRVDETDLLFVSEQKKLEGLYNRIKNNIDKGLPTLVGTISIEQSEKLEKYLSNKGLKNLKVLNAKNHAKEAEIINTAGEPGSVTIATNMAGRGVDIKIEEEVLKKGGLQLIGFERYHNRRIDNQLIGRAGRQGNPGNSVFLLSITDDLLRFPEREEDMNSIQKMTKAQLESFKEGAQIDILSNLVKKSQKGIEGQHYEQRKTLFKLDKSFSTYRNNFYKTRQKILFSEMDFFEKDIFRLFDEEMTKIINERYKLNKLDVNGLIKDIKEVSFKIEMEEVIKYNTQSETIEEFSSKLKEELSKQINKNLLINLENIKTTYLYIFDQEWIKFLGKSENIKKGIWFRQNTQKDPVFEYQKELEKYYALMKQAIKKDILREIVISLSNEVIVEIENQLNTKELVEIEQKVEELEYNIEVIKKKSKDEIQKEVISWIDRFVLDFVGRNKKVFVNYIQHQVKGKKDLEKVISEFNEILQLVKLELKDFNNKSLKEMEQLLIVKTRNSTMESILLLNEDDIVQRYIESIEHGINEFNNRIVEHKNIKEELVLLDKLIIYTFIVLLNEERKTIKA